MWNADIAVLPAPTRHRHAGTAVRTADRMRARNRQVASGAGGPRAAPPLGESSADR